MKVSKRWRARRVIAAWAIMALCASGPLPAALSADSAANAAALNAKAMSLQTRIFGKAPANQALTDRIVELEKYLLGKPQDGDGDADARLKRLQETLDGKPRQPARESEEQPPVNNEIFDASKSEESAPLSMPFTPDQMETQSQPSESSAASKSFTSIESSSASQRPASAAPGPVPKTKSQAQSAQKMDRRTFAKAVKILEERVFGHSDNGTDAEASLAHLETFAFGKPQSGVLERRLARVQGVLNGSDPGDQNVDEQTTAGQTSKDQTTAGQTTSNQTTSNQTTSNQTTSEQATSEQTTSGQQAGGQSAGGPTKENNGAATVGGATVGGATAGGARPAHVLRGHVDTLAATYNLAGISLKSNTLPSPVSVRLGSRALRAGVMDNDRLLHAELGVDTLSLVLERNGHKFALEVPLTDNTIATKLNSNDVRLAGGTGTTATGNKTTIKGTAAQDWKILKQYNIAVLLDVSGSMGGLQRLVGMTKNDWCRQEISSFAAEAERLGSGTFDFGTFSSDYNLTPNCSAAQAVAQLASNPPHGGTNIAAPLQAAIDTRYTKSMNKPFLIVVITDGIPGGGEPLDSLIVRASQQARSAGDIKIIFLQIGEGNGQVLAEFLDTQLMSEGAPYDIVSSIEWDQLSQIGLRSGLIAALNKPAGAERVTDPQKIMQFDDLRNRLALSKQRFDGRINMQQQRQILRDWRTNPGGLINPGRVMNPGGFSTPGGISNPGGIINPGGFINP